MSNISENQVSTTRTLLGGLSIHKLAFSSLILFSVASKVRNVLPLTKSGLVQLVSCEYTTFWQNLLSDLKTLLKIIFLLEFLKLLFYSISKLVILWVDDSLSRFLLKKVNFTQSQFEAMRGAHLLFYSHEPEHKMTYDCWLDIQLVDAVYFLVRAGTPHVSHLAKISFRIIKKNPITIKNQDFL